jgi:hypothetical protein
MISKDSENNSEPGGIDRLEAINVSIARMLAIRMVLRYIFKSDWLILDVLVIASDGIINWPATSLEILSSLSRGHYCLII